jgi:hypothetical protein
MESISGISLGCLGCTNLYHSFTIECANEPWNGFEFESSAEKTNWVDALQYIMQNNQKRVSESLSSSIQSSQRGSSFLKK